MAHRRRSSNEQLNRQETLPPQRNAKSNSTRRRRQISAVTKTSSELLQSAMPKNSVHPRNATRKTSVQLLMPPMPQQSLRRRPQRPLRRTRPTSKIAVATAAADMGAGQVTVIHGPRKRQYCSHMVLI